MAAKRTGLQGNVTNHAVRKTSICCHLDADVPGNYVTQLSGHKNLKSLDSSKSASLLSHSEHMEQATRTTISNELAISIATASTTKASHFD